MNYPYDAGFVAGSATSQASAASLDRHLTGMREQVFDVLCARGKAACFQIQEEFPNWADKTASARISELVILGYVYDTGEKITNPRGIQVKVWSPVMDPSQRQAGVRKASNPYVGHSTQQTREKIWIILDRYGGLHYEEIFSITGMRPSTVTPALADMKLLGQAIATGDKRPTSRGRLSMVLLAGIRPPGVRLPVLPTPVTF